MTFLQTLIDAANAMRNSPGDFRSTGHDYRADTARFVAEGFRLPYSEAQMARVEAKLRELEKERAERIKGDGSETSDRPAEAGAPTEPPTSPTAAPAPSAALGSRTAGPAWIRKSGIGG